MAHRVLVAFLVICHALLWLHCAWTDSITSDEVGNLTAGLCYWEFGEYGLYNVNPPLPKLLSGLLIAQFHPNLDAIRLTDHDPRTRPEFEIGEQFAKDHISHYHTFMVTGRLPGLFWSLLGAWLVNRWASELGGSSGGLIALGAWCFEPNILAYGHLITNDLAATVAGLGAAYALRRALITPSKGSTLLAGLALGLALLCKFTLLILLPVWLFLALALTITRGGRPLFSLFLQGLLQTTAIFFLAWVVLNLGYEGSGFGTPLGDFRFVSESLAGTEAERGWKSWGNRFQDSIWGRLPVPVPAPMLRGIDVQRLDFELYRTRPKYLRGEWRVEGWWYYYLYAFAVKVPLGTQALLLGAILGVAFCPSLRPSWREAALLLLPGLVIFAFVSSQMSLQRHLRYVLPAFPFALIFLGILGRWFLPPRRWLPGLVVGLSLLSGISYLRVHPHALSYFHEAAGGPNAGAFHLEGSNFDWGQDVYRLMQWVEAHPEAKPLYLFYRHHFDPQILGLEYQTTEVEASRPVLPGYYVMSPYRLQVERANIPRLKTIPLAPGQPTWTFLEMTPIAKAGYTLWIYSVTLEQANDNRRALGLPPLAEAPVPRAPP